VSSRWRGEDSLMSKNSIESLKEPPGGWHRVCHHRTGSDGIQFTFVSDEYNGVTKGADGIVRPLKPRSFNSLSEAEEENGQSRIYLGIHWSFDKERRDLPRPECCRLRICPHLHAPAHVRPSYPEEQQALNFLEIDWTIPADLCIGEIVRWEARQKAARTA